MKIPILLYHALFNNEELSKEKYAVNKGEFEKQIEYLAENGFQSLLVDDFCKPYNAADRNRNAIVITFDDGNYSDYSIAFPILKKYGLVATFFVITNWIGTKNFADWSHLKEMIENGMSIQSHSLSHSHLPDLSFDNLYKEVNESKNILEEKLNMIVNAISLPGGFCSRKVLNMAKDVGYKTVCTSVPGMNRIDSQEKQFSVLNRFAITRKTSFQGFKAIVHGDQKQLALYKVQHYLKSGAKKILGSKRYSTIRSKFLERFKRE